MVSFVAVVIHILAHCWKSPHRKEAVQFMRWPKLRKDIVWKTRERGHAIFSKSTVLFFVCVRATPFFAELFDVMNK